MGRKYAVLGVGHVGATVAFALVTKGDADELVLIDKDEKKARAEQLDLEDATARLETRPKIKIQDYSELADTDILFVTAGNILALKHQTGNNRWAEFNDTRQIVKDIAPKIKASGFHDVLIDTMNLCDAITQYLQKEIGSSVNAIAKAAEEAGVIKNKAHTNETDIDPTNGLTCILLAIKALTSNSNGVVTAAKPKPQIPPTKVAANGTSIISKGVLPVKYLPTKAAINPAKTALTGWPVAMTALPAA